MSSVMRAGITLSIVVLTGGYSPVKCNAQDVMVKDGEMKRVLPPGLTKASLTPEEQALHILADKVACTGCAGTGIYIWRHEDNMQKEPVNCGFCRHTGFGKPDHTVWPEPDILERYREYGLIE